ncbi:MAG: hypothetical protein KH457_08805, partial [Propionibacterium sp.]|nr:hypothetical protein [Propionibacterium sp.]
PQPRKTRRIRTSQQNQPQSDHHQQRQQPNQPYQINPDYQSQNITAETTIRKSSSHFQPPLTRREPAEA